MAKRGRSATATGPTGTPRAGRREHDRTLEDRRPFLERYRTALVVVGALAIVTIVGGFLFIQTTSKAYACSTILLPKPAASAVPGGTPAALGQPADDLGRQHVARGQSVAYTYCPPSSGSHYNDLPDGPIPAKFYGLDEQTLPQGWIHNLEHGAMVVLYNCATGGCSDVDIAALRAYFGERPRSPLCGLEDTLIITRFDDMAEPFAAVVWDRVLYQPTLDVAGLRAFWDRYADRGPEAQCQEAVPGYSPSLAPTASPAAISASPASPPASAAP
ncbi:MAG: DUF3105 domain-containing protein [Chloroflexota bacterium]